MASSDKDSSKEDGLKLVQTFSVISLGCPKNLVDSETMTARLVRAGLRFAPDGEKVDLAIINTCGFLQSARDEAFDCIQEMIRLKNRRMVRYIVVTGCIIPLDKNLSHEYPQVDAWLAPNDEFRIVETVFSLLNDTTQCVLSDGNRVIVNPDETCEQKTLPLFLPEKSPLLLLNSPRQLLTANHVAYLKIADGCNRFCSYCLIPTIRGRFTSRNMDSILDEAKRLAEGGVRELVIIAQETTFWGDDLTGQPRLAQLLIHLRELGLFDWIRVLYSHPHHFDDSLLEVFGSVRNNSENDEKIQTKILPYIDLPLQHCNNGILKRMNRRMCKSETEELLARLREKVPGVVLRTSMIVGFPGETDAIFEELVAFMEKWKFERAGVFPFSPESGTSAALMPDQIPDSVRNRRAAKLYAKQERITHKIARQQVGQILDVMIDRQGSDENDSPVSDLYIGRTQADSPDIDPVVYVTGEGLVTGSIVPCEIIDVEGLDLIAVPV